MAYSLANLRQLADEQLIALHDADAEHTVVGVNYYLEELRRRETERQTEKIVDLTKAVAVMTLVMTAATIVNVVLFAL